MKKLFPALFLVALLSACGSGTASNPSPSPASSSAPTAAASPTLPAGFVCSSLTGGAATDSTVTNVTVAQQSGYDRFTIEFGGDVPAYSVTLQSGATFTRSPKGDQVTLQGANGVLVVTHSVTNWTSYAGPTGFQPGYPYLRQAMLVENFEGYQQWALGVQGTPCVRVATLSSPTRLVVDIAAS